MAATTATFNFAVSPDIMGQGSPLGFQSVASIAVAEPRSLPEKERKFLPFTDLSFVLNHFCLFFFFFWSVVQYLVRPFRGGQLGNHCFWVSLETEGKVSWWARALIDKETEKQSWNNIPKVTSWENSRAKWSSGVQSPAAFALSPFSPLEEKLLAALGDGSFENCWLSPRQGWGQMLNVLLEPWLWLPSQLLELRCAG